MFSYSIHISSTPRARQNHWILNCTMSFDRFFPIKLEFSVSDFVISWIEDSRNVCKFLIVTWYFSSYHFKILKVIMNQNSYINSCFETWYGQQDWWIDPRKIKKIPYILTSCFKCCQIVYVPLMSSLLRSNTTSADARLRPEFS